MGIETLIPIFLAAFSSLFTIVNPFSTASVFLTITRQNTKKEKIKMSKRACITAAIVLIIFSIVGPLILAFFNITLDAFKIGGGLIVSTIGFKMIHSQRKHFHTEEQKKEAIKKDDVSIIPLAIPMLSGPGAMTTSIVVMGDASGFLEMLTILIAIVVVCWLSYIVLSKANKVDKHLGETGRLVADRVMGLIVLVVGIQFIINGIHSLVASWI
jgi:multiple antibiotic resistance protein